MQKQSGSNQQISDEKSIDEAITRHKADITEHEKKLWSGSPDTAQIQTYQNSFKQLETLYQKKLYDDRYNFKIVIPVADRPKHLKHCLDSLLTLCHYYAYGGIENNRYKKISVLIADDSKHQENIKRNQSYCTEFTAAGITTEYFGLEEQLALVNAFTVNDKTLDNIIPSTAYIETLSDYAHKGASNMRNICYLKLNTEVDDATLIYFIDSDQEFCITADHTEEHLFAINYFHCLNENFKTRDITLLTGKVVGDPPVSPAVMAGNFQQDIKSFLNTMQKLEPHASCQFHQHQVHRKDDAAYHDMANLFGFDHKDLTFTYHCTIPTAHTNVNCFCDFANKLSHFFYGEHPTRKTFFDYDSGFTRLTPARTVYTGNYVIKREALAYFIPFAPLKLRMAGPVLGRILQTQLGDKFVSANLPMLHNRTVDTTGQSEFRAGVENIATNIDLGNEFIRQFYGDVMLFSMVEITRDGYPSNVVDTQSISQILTKTYEKIRASYIEKHDTILSLKAELHAAIANNTAWWNIELTNDLALTRAKTDFDNFLNNIQLNFDAATDAYQQITLIAIAEKHLDDILQAILQYQLDQTHWKKAIN